MNPRPSQHAFQILRRAGLARKQIARLCRLQHTYQLGKLDQPPVDRHRLQFARWLVTTGRLTEQCLDSREKSCPASLQHIVPEHFPGDAVPFLFF